MQKRLDKSNKGFTIIEVLIVLAIAGLIMLIVFLAVPALQRNSRTTQAKNAAASILGAVGEYSANNNGGLPTECVIDPAGVITLTGPTGASATAKTQPVYTCEVVTGAPAAFPLASSATGVFTIAFNHKCSGNTGFVDVNRATAVGFVLDNEVQQCVES